jgi:hypothetical protein
MSRHERRWSAASEHSEELCAAHRGTNSKPAIRRASDWILAFVAIAVAIAVTIVGWWLAASRSAVDSHQRMLAVLQEVKQRTPDENPYLGDSEWRLLRDQLSWTGDSRQRLSLEWRRGLAALQLGRTEESIAALHAVEAGLPTLRQTMPPDMVRQFEQELPLNLAIAYLRHGENENCVFCQTGESCILPIQGTGVHVRPGGSQAALKYLELFLREQPDHLVARWLLNLAHMTLGTYPDGVPKEQLIPPERFRSSVEFPRFPNVAKRVGLNTFGLAGGVLVDDFDGDGYLDVVVSDWDPAADLRYFRNNGDGSFTDRSHAAGFSGLSGGLNLRHADYDNDGDLDILVLRGGWMGPQSGHPNSLLRNDGQAVFRDVTFDAGLGDVHYPTQTADWADYDNDGDLDLYVGNEEVPSQLFRNNGRGKFVDVARQAGVENMRYAKGVTWGDYDHDRYPDLYVSNLGGENRLYHNNRDGTFTDVAAAAGVARPLASFPVWFWDFNNDGHLDIYVSAYSLEEGMRNFVADFLELPQGGEVDRLYQGDGRGGFRDVAEEQQTARVTLPMGSNFGDLNADGYLDYYLGTGYINYEVLMPNRMFLNDGGRGFTEVTMAGGFGHVQKGHGVSFADLDNDGDQDVFIVLGGAFRGDGFTNALFENPGFGNHWIVIELVGTKSNRAAIGARLKLTFDDRGRQRSVYRWVGGSSSFGANPMRQEVGVGQATAIETLEIFWPTTGQSQKFHDVASGQYVEITEGQAEYRQRDWKPITASASATSPGE